jgi:hypothetical protein
MNRYYFRNSELQLFTKVIMADVKSDAWLMFDFKKNIWNEVLDPTAEYFDKDFNSVKLNSSVGLVEISKDQLAKCKLNKYAFI